VRVRGLPVGQPQKQAPPLQPARGGGGPVHPDRHPPDFRDQALAYGILRVDAVLFTHAHADHLFGFDDLRRFNTLQGGVIPVYGSAATMDEVRRIFDYAFKPAPPGLYRPQVTLHPVERAFALGGVTVTPAPVWHGGIATNGYRLDAGGRSMGYVPDCLSMTPEIAAMFTGVDVMVLDALRHTPHFSHSHLETSLALLAKSGRNGRF